MPPVLCGGDQDRVIDLQEVATTFGGAGGPGKAKRETIKALVFPSIDIFTDRQELILNRKYKTNCSCCLKYG